MSDNYTSMHIHTYTFWFFFLTGDDYSLPVNNSNVFTVTFAVGSGGSGDSTVETVTISAVEDTAVEGDHEFTVSIQSTSLPAMFGMSSVMATIMDDDCKSTLKCELIIVVLFTGIPVVLMCSG